MLPPINSFYFGMSLFGKIKMTTEKSNGRILSIDYGSKRIGFAVSDESRLLATPLPVLLNRPPQIWQQLDVLVKEKNISQILIGYPSTADGGKINLHEQIENFMGYIHNKYPNITIETIDEAYSSEAANSLLRTLSNRHVTSLQQKQKQKKKLDSVAAALLLQIFLDKNNNSKLSS